MKVISITTDLKIFEDTPVRRRMIGLAKNFSEMHLVVFNLGNSYSVQKISDNLFVHPTFSRSKILYPFNAFVVAKKIINKIGNSGVVVTTQDPFETGFSGLLLKLRFGVPLQVQIHTDFYNKYFIKTSLLNFIRFFIAHIVLPYADNVRAVSQKVARSVSDLCGQIFVLPIFQDMQDTIKPKEKFNGKIVAISRLEPEKDLVTAIDAFARLLSKHQEARFTIVGDGSERKKLEAKVKSLNLTGKIEFVGWKDNVKHFLESADIFLSTSKYEGYGLSMVEAGVFGLPMVLTRAGVAEDFEKEDAALVCEPGNVEGIANSLDLLWDENFRIKLSEKAAKTANSIIVDKDKYESIFVSKIKELRTEPKKLVERLFELATSIFKRNKIIRFVIAGGTSAFVQIAILYFFTDVLNFWYLYSSIISFGVALVVSFTLQKFWAFRDRVVSGMHLQFVKYAAIVLCGLFMNTVFMYILVDLLGVWYMFAQIIAGIAIAVFNFFMYKKFIFKN